MASDYFIPPAISETPPNIFKSNTFSGTATSSLLIWTPASGKKIVLYGYTLSAIGLVFLELLFPVINDIGSLAGDNSISVPMLTRPLESTLINGSMTLSYTIWAATTYRISYSVWGREI